MKAADDTKQGQATASWLAGHAQAMRGGDRTPAPSIKNVASWMLGYDVGTKDRQEEEDYTPSNNADP